MTKVLVATDFKMICREGNIYLKDTTYNTMLRYKKAFGYVVLCTRNYPNENSDDFVLANDVVDDVVKISNLSNTLWGKHDEDIEKVIEEIDLVVVRVPSIISYKAAGIALKKNKPIFSVAIGCAWDAYWNHKFPGKLIAPYMFFKMRWCMKKSDYALYVTEEFLQRRYPSKCRSIGVSDVVIHDLDNSIIEARIKKIQTMQKNTITLMTSGSVGNRAKGQEYMIKAIPLLNKQGIKVRYLLAGAESPEYLRGIAKKLNVEKQVMFLGMLSTDKVFENLDKTDIYIQPSLQEGLPRAVVEAMSRGCPVIGANTGGIPELISKECIVSRKSEQSIVRAIINMLKDNRLNEEAVRNFEKSKLYNENLLEVKRNDYYSYIIESLSER